METFLKIFAMGVLGCLAVVFTIFFGFYFLLLLGGILGLFLIVWAMGMPITITENGIKTGYIRWFKFYSTQ